MWQKDDKGLHLILKKNQIPFKSDPVFSILENEPL